ncbi:hypothetical protein [Streptomyces sp. NPDC001833]|uniref:hypothetical protein n=1 Tax=Streptomyces sp. NPDC001833 TaxID=3154658 RepID=UPI00332A4D52
MAPPRLTLPYLVATSRVPGSELRVKFHPVVAFLRSPTRIGSAVDALSAFQPRCRARTVLAYDLTSASVPLLLFAQVQVVPQETVEPAWELSRTHWVPVPLSCPQRLLLR